MDLLTYQSTKEDNDLFRADNLFVNGDMDAAVGYLECLAATLSIKLPKRPLPTSSHLDNMRQLRTHFLNCRKRISEHRGETIKDVRQSYSKPFSVQPKGATKAA